MKISENEMAIQESSIKENRYSAVYFGERLNLGVIKFRKYGIRNEISQSNWQFHMKIEGKTQVNNRFIFYDFLEKLSGNGPFQI